MVSCLFNGLVGRAGLVAQLRVHILKFFSCVVLPACLLEVPFHHADVLLVGLMIHAWVPNDCDTELVEALGNLFAF